MDLKIKYNVEELKNVRIEDYTYSLDDDRIAKFPLENRSLSKLLIYKDGNIKKDVFSNVPNLLKKNQLLIFNNTRVIHARIFFKKTTGANLEIFCLEPRMPIDYALNFAAKGSCVWSCMVGHLKKWKEGNIVCDFKYGENSYVLSAEKLKQEGGEVEIKFTWDADISFSEVLEACGKIPIPPYLNRESDASDEIRYQTVYSKIEGSVAAPTAGLHFTNEILSDLKSKGIDVESLTLHVGAGTFRPVKSKNIGGHNMHTEHIVINRHLIEILKNYAERKNDEINIIAVGTTSVRTLESLYWMGVKRILGNEVFWEVGQWETYEVEKQYTLLESMESLLEWFDQSGREILQANTTIIIVPGYKYRVVDAMFTNFHQPQSTLLLLVAAAVGGDWKRIYRYALDNNFRFLSYGDSNFLKIRK